MRALYSVREAAALAGVAPRTINDWIASGGVEAERINGRWRIPARVVHQWLGVTPEAISQRLGEAS